MILKGSLRGGAAQLARHLLNTYDNDHVTIHEIRGFVADDLLDAFKESHAISLGTRCSQFLFSLSLNPPELEKVPVEVFEETIDTIEQTLGLADQPRAIIFHEKSGRRHAHCVWSRIDAQEMRAVKLPHYKLKLQDIARQLYLDHQWEMPEGLRVRGQSDPLNYTQAEGLQAKRRDQSPQELKALFQKCWSISDSQIAFANALRENGLCLAKGDRRGFVAVDRDGEVYSVSRWVGVKAKEVRKRLGSSDALPNVEEALGYLNAQITDEPDHSHEQAQYDRRIEAFNTKRLDLISQQRQERKELRAIQEARLSQARKDCQLKIPAGLKATWLKISGQYQQHLDQLQQQITATKEQNSTEWQELVDHQLKERRTLQQELRQLQLTREIDIKTRRREQGAMLRSIDNVCGRPKRWPVLDPRQPLVLPEEEEKLSIAARVRHSPATILEVITDKKQIFTRNDVVRELATYIEEPVALRLAIEQVFQSTALVELQTEPTSTYTTWEMQELTVSFSEKIKHLAQQKSFNVKSEYSIGAITHQNKALQLAVGADLSAEQVSAIQHVLKPEQLTAVVGFAGAGKSTMLAAARQAWEKQGYRVIGATLSGKAADSLEKSSGITCRTLASLEYSLEQGYDKALQSGDILVVDEAGMVGLRQLNRFVEHVRSRGAKLVLVGDTEQLQPIQAGTPFKEVTEKIDVAKLTEIRRQRESWQRTASQDLAQNHIDKALSAYERRGFVKRTGSHSDAISTLVDEYLQDFEVRGWESSRLALAHRRKDVHLINQTIRANRKAAGELNDELLVKTAHGPRTFSAGDRILFTRNDRELCLRNGMLGQIECIENKKIIINLDTDSGENPRRITLSTSCYNALDHGYATTIHKSQGATVDRTFVLASTTMDSHMTYVAMTRHKKHVHLYADEKALRKITLNEGIQQSRLTGRDQNRWPSRTK